MGGRSKGSWRSGLLVLLLATIVILLVGNLSLAQQDFDNMGYLTPPAGDCPYVPNEVLVTLRKDATEADLAKLNQSFGSTTLRKSQYFKNLYVLRLSGNGTQIWNTPADKFLNDISNKPSKAQSVVAAQRNYKYYPMAQPNDPLWTYQWALKTGVIPVTNLPTDHIFAEQAWDIEKGKKDVVVAVIDTGVRTSPAYDTDWNIIRYPHPDLGNYRRDTTALTGVSPRVYPNVYTNDVANNRLLYGIDFAYSDDSTDPAPSDSTDPFVSSVAPHATHVTGIIAAKTNNSAGIAGLCWSNVWVLPLKVFADDAWYASDFDIADAIMSCIAYKNESAVTGTTLKVDVINLSLGSQYPSAIEQSAIRQAVRSGIVVVGAAGNSWDVGAYPPAYPGAFDEVICVGSTKENDRISNFSQRGHAIDIAAPGESILSTYWNRNYIVDQNITNYYTPPDNAPVTVTIQPGAIDIWGNGYAYMSGTSMAAPMVSAAAALLRSLDVPAEDVREILCEAATPTGIGRPNDTYGWGLLNVEAALKRACIEVKVQAPSAGTLVNSKRPRFRIDFRRAEKETIRVWIDGVLVLRGDSGANFDQYYYTLNEAAGKTYLLFDYSLGTEGPHTIRASADSNMTLANPPDPPFTDEDSVDFRVVTKKLNKGWHLFSVPYWLDTDPPETPEVLLNTNNGILARWNYADSAVGSYAMYVLDGSRTDPEASFTPPKAINVNDEDGLPPPPGDPSATSMPLVYPLSSINAAPPAGLGYWLYVANPDGIDLPEVVGKTIDTEPYVIGLYRGWNMVGDPFPFPVNWASVVVEYAGMRVPATEAVANGWLSNWVYRYENSYRRYSWQNVSSAVMRPWEAQWIKVNINGPEGHPEPDIKLIVPPSAYTGVLQ